MTRATILTILQTQLNRPNELVIEVSDTHYSIASKISAFEYVVRNHKLLVDSSAEDSQDTIISAAISYALDKNIDKTRLRKRALSNELTFLDFEDIDLLEMVRMEIEAVDIEIKNHALIKGLLVRLESMSEVEQKDFDGDVLNVISFYPPTFRSKSDFKLEPIDLSEFQLDGHPNKEEQTPLSELTIRGNVCNVPHSNFDDHSDDVADMHPHAAQMPLCDTPEAKEKLADDLAIYQNLSPYKTITRIEINSSFGAHMFINASKCTGDLLAFLENLYRDRSVVLEKDKMHIISSRTGMQNSDEYVVIDNHFLVAKEIIDERYCGLGQLAMLRYHLGKLYKQ